MQEEDEGHGDLSPVLLASLGPGFLTILSPGQSFGIRLLMVFCDLRPAILDAAMAFLSQPTFGGFVGTRRG